MAAAGELAVTSPFQARRRLAACRRRGSLWVRRAVIEGVGEALGYEEVELGVDVHLDAEHVGGGEGMVGGDAGVEEVVDALDAVGVGPVVGDEVGVVVGGDAGVGGGEDAGGGVEDGGEGVVGDVAGPGLGGVEGVDGDGGEGEPMVYGGGGSCAGGGSLSVEGAEGVGWTWTFGVLRLRCAPLRMTVLCWCWRVQNAEVLRSAQDDGEKQRQRWSRVR